MLHLLYVMLGGGIGAGLRHLVGLAALRLFGPGFPWGTLTVNIVGSLVMGVFIELLARKFGGTTELRLFVATGILGGFTTFSAFSLDAVLMYERGQIGVAGAYIASSVILSIAALMAGLWLARTFS